MQTLKLLEARSKTQKKEFNRRDRKERRENDWNRDRNKSFFSLRSQRSLRLGFSTALLVMTVAIAVAVIVSGCSANHETMRGSIVMVLEKEAHICLGSQDGIRVGERVTVYRTKEIPSTKEAIVPDRSGTYKPRTKYTMVKVGIGEVTEILSEHYAAIKIVEGEFQANDIVEKQQRP